MARSLKTLLVAINGAFLLIHVTAAAELEFLFQEPVVTPVKIVLSWWGVRCEETELFLSGPWTVTLILFDTVQFAFHDTNWTLGIRGRSIDIFFIWAEHCHEQADFLQIEFYVCNDGSYFKSILHQAFYVGLAIYFGKYSMNVQNSRTSFLFKHSAHL